MIKCVPVVDLLKINLSDPDTYVKLQIYQFLTEEQLKKLLHQDKVTSADVRSFKKEASSMVVAIMEKITEKSPLHFTVVKNANAFDLTSMTNLEPIELRANMRNLLTCIVSLNILSATFAEQALPQYSDLLAALTQQKF